MCQQKITCKIIVCKRGAGQDRGCTDCEVRGKTAAVQIEVRGKTAAVQIAVNDCPGLGNATLCMCQQKITCKIIVCKRGAGQDRGCTDCEVRGKTAAVQIEVRGKTAAVQIAVNEVRGKTAAVQIAVNVARSLLRWHEKVPQAHFTSDLEVPTLTSYLWSFSEIKALFFRGTRSVLSTGNNGARIRRSRRLSNPSSFVVQ